MKNETLMFGGEEHPEFDPFFSAIADILEEFASMHNLRLVKYYHGEPSWRFNFGHPKGGAASVDLIKESSNSLKVYQYWWIDSFENFTRSAKQKESEPISPDVITLESLEDKLIEILAWDLDDWTEIASGYEQHWKPMGKQWLKIKSEQYPTPRI
jgi:hypothetical protein